MGQRPAAGAPPRYRAFISYSHTDSAFANWLHGQLERFRAPSPDAQGSVRLAPVFIDRAELAAGPDLSAQVREALSQSAALVVIASPAARTSRWVDQEIQLFRTLNPAAPILTALIAGSPDAAFPPALLQHGELDLEPLAADFRKQGDGKRLGLLKIAAGLARQPLDRLVQRDAQSRQRRVMAVTAGAVALSLVLAALLLLAQRARAEAEAQRADAEGMVEFMLTDLRDKLKGVGSLSTMDTVNQRALEYYARQDLAALPDTSLERRARLLQAMAEDNLRTAAGRDRARKEAFEASRVTGGLLERQPRAPERIFNHAQSEYLLGYIAFRTKSADGNRDLAAAKRHWGQYLNLANQLVTLAPGKPRWVRERGYAHGNLCAANLAAPARPQLARMHCTAAREIAEQLWQQQPSNFDNALDYANRLAWEADALTALEQFAPAIELRTKQRQIARALGRDHPKDARATEAEMLAGLGLAKLLGQAGRPDEARRVAREARDLADRLSRRDPANADWAGWRNSADMLIAAPVSPKPDPAGKRP
ncbi:toll/interleukin-1 receptor domain-containing protein [Novosphingobium sp.]|uniref:toll/interleukin-1 receptor domain-containing protein n=1 Tax=Novosphingobium sp. TaxID=1874826 RepID=UPI002736DF91|nr:toll/interleukin-1 receptor domain-containing protein [Novosphingobium sp.]MDP3907706.1 toll/interleukin-1 receptor domain-containing protein [Novosphingobium sp.]